MRTLKIIAIVNVRFQNNSICSSMNNNVCLGRHGEILISAFVKFQVTNILKIIYNIYRKLFEIKMHQFTINIK